jgi:hypothetical protein
MRSCSMMRLSVLQGLVEVAVAVSNTHARSLDAGAAVDSGRLEPPEYSTWSAQPGGVERDGRC